MSKIIYSCVAIGIDAIQELISDEKGNNNVISIMEMVPFLVS
jgi:hypothetical protein